jgi:opine dehydrogenase
MATIAVLGAGNGGCAAAGDLARRGHAVRLYSRSPATLAPLVARGGVELRGAAGEGFVPLPRITGDLGAAVDGADVVLLVVPSLAHPWYGEQLAPLLQPAQIVLLNPGHTLGGLAFAASLRRAGYAGRLRLGETATLTYCTRLVGPATVDVFRVAPRLPFAAFPGRDTAALLAALQPLYPALAPAASVLETALMDINAVEHPPQALCNAGWIEATAGDFYFYYEGTSPAVARAIEALDAERLALVRALGFEPVSFLARFHEAGYTTDAALASGSVYHALQESAANRWIRAPRSLDHRYLHEDVGCGLVPWCEIAVLAGVPTPLMRGLVDLAGALVGRDYWATGRTLAALGVGGMGLAQLAEYIAEGDEY